MRVVSFPLRWGNPIEEGRTMQRATGWTLWSYARRDLIEKLVALVLTMLFVGLIYALNRPG